MMQRFENLRQRILWAIQSQSGTIEKFKVYAIKKREWFVINIRKEVWDHPSISTMPAWLLLGLGYLMYFLAERYAIENAPPIGNTESIVVYCALLATIFALALSEKVSAPSTSMDGIPGRGFIKLSWRLPSLVLSALDYFLVRVISTISTAMPPESRVPAVIFLYSLCFYVEPPWGFLPSAALSIAAFSVIRRYSWAEDERSRFVIERFERNLWRERLLKSELRDDAAFSLIILIFLMPLFLRQLDWSLDSSLCASGSCLGNIHVQKPTGTLSDFTEIWNWLLFSGSHIVKAVPFVDWSEVFGVKSDWGEPGSVVAREIIFVLRAMLDILFLATLQQVIQTSFRNASLVEAFENGSLPLLEPMREAEKLRELGSQIAENDFGLPITEHPAIRRFSPYDEKRLRTLLHLEDGKTRETDPCILAAAASLLAAKHVTSETTRFFTLQLNEITSNPESADELEHLHMWMTKAISHQPPELPKKRLDKSSHPVSNLVRLQNDKKQHSEDRASAIRALSRFGKLGETTPILESVLNDGHEHISVRIAALLGLSNLQAIDEQKKLDIAKDLMGRLMKSNDRLKRNRYSDASALAYIVGDKFDPDMVDDLSADKDGSGRIKLGEALQYCSNISKFSMNPVESAASPDHASNFELVRIDPAILGGEFTMGSVESQSGLPSERKAHEVDVSRAFELGRFAVTEMECAVFQLLNGGEIDKNTKTAKYEIDPFLPKVNISLIEAFRLCGWLERITGFIYRLPSEAEWEYACRAGSSAEYSCGDTITKTHANFSGSHDTPGRVFVSCPNYESNQWGLYQMHGNVFEWCADPWHENYNDKKPPFTQAPWLEGGDFDLGVMRGGGWYSKEPDLRAARRLRYPSIHRIDYGGFRIVREPPLEY